MNSQTTTQCLSSHMAAHTCCVSRSFPGVSIFSPFDVVEGK